MEKKLPNARNSNEGLGREGGISLVSSGVKPIAATDAHLTLLTGLQLRGTALPKDRSTEDMPLLTSNEAVAGPSPCGSTNYNPGLQSASCTGPSGASHWKFPVGEQGSCSGALKDGPNVP